MGKQVKFKCPHCGSNNVEEYWQTDKYVLLCEECNTMSEFSVTSKEDMDHLYDLEYNEWVAHEWPEYTTTCDNGCCDINLPDEEEKEADDTETKCDLGCCEASPEWYKDEVIRLHKVVGDQELIIEALLDKIRYERNR